MGAYGVVAADRARLGRRRRRIEAGAAELPSLATVLFLGLPHDA